MDDFKALVAEKDGDEVRRELRTLSADDLHDGEVTIKVGWSSVNYKDALAVSPKGQVAQTSPLVPGIDLAGEVVESSADGISEGDAVLAHGYGVGVSHHGGFAEYARVPGDWVVPLPDGLDARHAMALGTAGFTAALSVVRLEHDGVSPDGGPVLVLGATGGVGATAVAILAERGYEVVASTGKSDEEDWLRSLGAGEIISRDETSGEAERPLEKQRWAAVVDPVGGAGTAYALRTVKYGGAVAVSGLVAGTKLEATVLPFILRDVSLLGADSVGTPMEERREVWKRLVDDLAPGDVDRLVTKELPLDEVDGYLDEVLKGSSRGRVLVNVGD
jgi:putative YhdH/YhfP family quinone oxidoreductase